MSTKYTLPPLPEHCYWVDPNTNPSTWASGEVPEPGKYQAEYKVDVRFINIGSGSFQGLSTGRNDSVHVVLLAVAKHVARGFYNVVSLQMSEYSCVVVMRSDMSIEEAERVGFPWGKKDDPANVVTLK